MPSSAYSSYLAPAVEKVLGLFAGEDEVARGINGQLSSYHVFSYREDFDYLWGIGDSENESVVADAIASEQRSSLVLVNDGVPDASEQFAGPSLNIRDRITVYDWIVNFFSVCNRRGGCTERPALRSGCHLTSSGRLFRISAAPESASTHALGSGVPSLRRPYGFAISTWAFQSGIGTPGRRGGTQ